MTYTGHLIDSLIETVERAERKPDPILDRFDSAKLNRPCYRCGAPYGAHANVDERCPEGNWYSQTDTFLDLGPAHDQWVTGDNR